MDPTSFQAALCFYLGMDISHLSHWCNCKVGVADLRGDHSVRCCKGGGMNRLHDAVKMVFASVATSSGQKVIVEDNILFRERDGDCGRRSDVRVRCGGDQQKDLVLDFVATHPGQLTYRKHRNTANIPGQHLQIIERGKFNSYKEFIVENRNSVTFMPMAFDVYGSLSDNFINVCNKYFKIIAEIQGVNMSKLSHYWYGRISMAIYTSNANTFKDKRVQVHVERSRSTDYALHNGKAAEAIYSY
jgi:hypothetical protein